MFLNRINLWKKIKKAISKAIVFGGFVRRKHVAEFKIPVWRRKNKFRGTLQTDFREKWRKTIIQKVKVVKLDDFEPNSKLEKVDFHKIDVEGKRDENAFRREGKWFLKFKPTVMVEIEQRHHQEPVWNLISGNYFEAHYLQRKYFWIEKTDRRVYQIKILSL